MYPPRSALDKVADEERNLDDARFIPGDYIDVAILDAHASLPSMDHAARGARAPSESRDRAPFAPGQRPPRRTGRY